MDAYDFNTPIKTYEALTASFPFTDEARQARLDLIYAYYRAGEKESATDAAETFIRENPTHPRVDYAWYMKGLVDFERTPNAIERLFRVDLAKRPPSTARKAFAAFNTVVEQYPKSEYAARLAAAHDLPAQSAGRLRGARRALLHASAAPTSPQRSARKACDRAVRRRARDAGGAGDPDRAPTTASNLTEPRRAEPQGLRRQLFGRRAPGAGAGEEVLVEDLVAAPRLLGTALAAVAARDRIAPVAAEGAAAHAHARAAPGGACTRCASPDPAPGRRWRGRSRAPRSHPPTDPPR